MLKCESLINLFKDQNFAWHLLDSEIRIEMSDSPQPSDISQLLQLYMRAVEVMNTLVDPRETYFRNKVTALLAKNTVIKSLNKPKVEKVEVPAPKQSQILTSEKVEKKKKSLKSQKSAGLISSSGLQQKKKQLQLRLAYATQEHNPEGIKKLLANTEQSEIKISKKIETIMKSHEEQLKERINRRKLKTATCKSRAEDANESGHEIDHSSHSNNSSPLRMPNFNTIPEIIPETPLKMKDRKQYKSLQMNTHRNRQRLQSVQLDFNNKGKYAD